MKNVLFILLIGTFSLSSYGQSKKVIYKYKKYEKFDFQNLNIDGDASSPGDVSISPRFTKKFRNRLPERRNFNNEMRNGVQAIR